ncbi:MAG TPA: hypothetical protein VFK02_17895 [Kofleriaceae bacterium]|nr:hypothetical protein [Kofleriaceae bacterium]
MADAEPSNPPDRRSRRPPRVGAEDEVPRLPRGRGLRLSRPQLFRIAGTIAVLAFLLVMQRPCADAVSKFVTGFGSGADRGSAAAVMPRPGTVDVPAGSAAAPRPDGPAAVPAGGRGGSAGSGGPDLDPSLDHYERLRPGMTDAELKAAIERARARAGSAAP